MLPHERTLPKARSDRLELLRATRANLDPIWGLSLAPGLSALTDHVDGEPFATATDEDGFLHSLWRITDPVARRTIADTVAGAKLVLADGHHRFETAGNYRAERRASDTADPGADAIMTLVVELAPDQLCVRAIHRLLSGVARVDLRTALAGPFRVDAAGPNVPEGVAALETAMRESGGLGLVDRDGLALLLPRPSSRPAWATCRSSCATSTRRASTPGCYRGARREPRATATTPPRSRRRSRRATPMPRCCCARSGSTRSAPPPPPTCACRRRRRSSRPSPARAWCSAAWTTDWS